MGFEKPTADHTVERYRSFSRKKMYKLQKKDLNKASATLGRSFNDYPMFNYIIPDSEYRKDKLKYLCYFLLSLGIAKGEVIGPSNKMEGVSIWLSSNGSKSSGVDALRAGLLNLLIHIKPGTIRRFIEVGKIRGKKRTEIIKGQYYLCDMIGVDPLLQKQGFGRKMMEAKLLEFDREKMPCYLETSKHENIAYYKQFGFSQINRYEIQSLDVFCLKRDPNTPFAI
jgi:ribosomal protein S18 acetylase RimI-like enzyme